VPETKGAPRVGAKTGNKVGTQLLLAPHSKMRAGALALVRHESQAETLRVLIESALERYEGAHAPALDALMGVFRAAKIDPEHGVAAMLAQRITFTEIKDMPAESVRYLLSREA
jgi:hypothetical protein